MKDKVYTENTKEKNQHYTYVYYDNGTGYAKEKGIRSLIKEADRQMKLLLDAESLAGCKEIRIDPIECASVIRIIRLEVETKDCFRKILAEDMSINGKMLSQGLVVFVGEAPQMIVPVPENETWLSLCFEFEVVSADLAPLQAVFQAYEQEQIQTVKSYEEKYLQLLANVQPQEAPVSRQEQLMRDKLAYIQGTTVYRKLLKSKVDAMGLWNELDV